MMTAPSNAQAADSRHGNIRAAVEACAHAAPDNDAEAVRTIAAAIIDSARSVASRAERKAERRLARLVNDTPGRHFTVAFADRFLRPNAARTAIATVVDLLNRHGIPAWQGRWQRLLLRLLRSFGGIVPGLARNRVRKALAKEIARVTWPAESRALQHHLNAARGDGFGVILNAIGEQVLGTGEADARLERYQQMLRSPAVEAVSVKVSAIVARLDAFATEAAAPRIAERLARLVHAAAEGRPANPARVMLDMEEYRDVGLTIAALETLLGLRPTPTMRVGVVVQAYLADAPAIFGHLEKISQARVSGGGAPLHIRLVKGANLAMERVEASVRHWPLAPLATKAAVDANFRAILRRAVDAAAHGHITLGIGSHNAFDMALGLLWRARARAEDHVGIEMLVGIGSATARALVASGVPVTLYAPTVSRDDLLSAIAYLIRRFDENTGPENYLRHSFGITAGAPPFQREHRRVVASLAAPPPAPVLPAGWDAIRGGSNRTQDRTRTPENTAVETFANEPDTDWTAAHNRRWIHAALERWQAPEVRPIVAGQSCDGETVAITDPSWPECVHQQAMLADVDTINRAVEAAHHEVLRGIWTGSANIRARTDVLLDAARLVRERRARLIAAMVRETAKIVPEADVEVSEAIDFLTFYAHSARDIAARDAVRAVGLGVVVVASPWNFPLAIAIGGIAAALAAGNTVIFKPAPEAMLVGAEVASIFLDAGVPVGAFHFVPCSNEPAGRTLICHPDVTGVILTGGTATARRFLAWRPRLRLFAETGGKNAVIVTDSADRDLAIRHVVQGAFGHAGQKCSATSLLVCEAAVLDDPRFLERLKDAVMTLVTGPADHPTTDVPPLIRPPRDALARALETLEPGERWLVEPRRDAANPRLVSPGVKVGVRRGSFTHQTELFGPVLAVIEARNLADAVAIANDTPYGLTAGLQSLDPREQAYWKEHMRAGNLYINRPTTGAIVGRQPFGGLAASAFGPGAKAGGPNYVAQFAQLLPRTTTASGLVAVPAEAPSIAPVVPDYAAEFAANFAAPVNLAPLVGQDNLFRLIPLRALLIRLGRGATAWDAERMLTAARVVGCPVHVSAAEAAVWHAALGVPVAVEPPETLAATLARLTPEPERVRVSGAIADVLLEACHARGWHVEDTPVALEPRAELLKYVREQSISVDWHRHGNLGDRDDSGEAA